MSNKQSAWFSALLGLILGMLFVTNYNLLAMHEWHHLQVDWLKQQTDTNTRYGALVCGWLEEIARIEAHMPPTKGKSLDLIPETDTI